MSQPAIDPTLTLWSTEQRDGLPLLVLLHGFGSDERDLFSLLPYLPTGIAVASLAAPGSPPAPMPGRAWFPMGTLGNTHEAIEDAASAVRRWVDDHAGTASSVALLGFSQGASVALQALRQEPQRFDAVLALSGVVSPYESDGDAALADRRPPVFWGRGTLDTIFADELIDHTAEWLPQHSTATVHLYPGLGHGISQEELGHMVEFIEAWRDTAA
ncbi:phospholipase/carboxylesterase [Tessaracoccus lubricantis]|uniref:Phospholipase/carboxylesterase n=1 Tax=Tessaracoccus lubricantis TaxID=545543 RepID=A0ABP9F4C7_9ACTN